mmetsp:Transcript_4812/g.10816  ORF Transcript_4812/g.10816 Transcript_4812/m.10816 type:complete len:98 (+) Transcript_4812:2205-2498(+)
MIHIMSVAAPVKTFRIDMSLIDGVKDPRVPMCTSMLEGVVMSTGAPHRQVDGHNRRFGEWFFHPPPVISTDYTAVKIGLFGKGSREMTGPRWRTSLC